MLARTESAISIRSPLEYNEQKVEEHKARLLDAHNFLQEKDELTVRDKRDRFQELTVRNERSQKKIVHLSVNFPVEDNLDDRQMVRIGTEFMQGIGFGDQPWLLYRHLDAGHPHFHIVTTNIRPDGSRISSDLRSPTHLKRVCFVIEEKHGLTPALVMPDLFGSEQTHDKTREQSRDQSGETRERTRYLEKAIYGKRPTKLALAEVIYTVSSRFAFTSFEAYNAILGLFNVRADRGREDSPMYRNNGLYYRMIDEQGRKVGAPIKASDFDTSVTLDKLAERFSLHQERIQKHMRHLYSKVAYELAGGKALYSLNLFHKELKRDKIVIAIPALTERPTRGHRATPGQDKTLAPDHPQSPDDGHGFFYVDCANLVVVRDTDLGADCTAATVLRRFNLDRSIRNLYDEGLLRVTRPTDQLALRPGHPDPAETRRAMLRLTAQHDPIIERKLAEEQEQILAQRQSRRHGHSL